MMRVSGNLSLLLLLFGAAAAQNAAPKVSITRWFDDHSAAISLTFDDGINTDLDHAGPILKKHHLSGTFFVTTAMGPWEKRKAEWKQLAQDGNELANHTVHHPCLLPEITPHSQDYTPELFEAEVADAAKEIAQTVDFRRGLTFAYPCGNMSFGKPQDEVKNSALYVRFVSEHAFGARGVGIGPANPDELNVVDVNDLGPTADKGFVDLLKLGQPAFDSHNWGIYCFHGVGGDWLAITPEALDELAAYLERHSEIWTATFGDVLRYIQERKAASMRLKSSDNNLVEIAMEWPLDRQIYDVPLTIKLEMPAPWNAVRVTGDNKPLTGKTTQKDNATVIVADVPAQTKLVTIRKEQP
jgi:peptidoglycan/xylan/chitin deacetylase (PgdA/CDA1 family)